MQHQTIQLFLLLDDYILIIQEKSKNRNGSENSRAAALNLAQARIGWHQMK